MKQLFAAMALCALSTACLAAEGAGAIVDKWYAALEAADRAAFEEIIADDAVITLNDLETDQTKREFIGSMDEWQDAMRGASIRHKIETSTADVASVLVCYTFPDNETLGRETFRVENGKIRESVQTVIGDSCAEY
jgi:methylphosphotriester-DNA--protein-cysteine methyltransferase